MGLCTLLLVFHLAHGRDVEIERRDAWSMGHRFEIWTETIPGRDVDGRPQRLEVDAAEAYADMAEAAMRDGVFLHVTSAYRSYGQQVRQHRKDPRLAVAPGWSTHQQGRSIDVENAVRRGRPTGVHWWLVANAGRFGFRLDVPREPWHITFYGPSGQSSGGGGDNG